VLCYLSNAATFAEAQMSLFPAKTCCKKSWYQFPCSSIPHTTPRQMIFRLSSSTPCGLKKYRLSNTPCSFTLLIATHAPTPLPHTAYARSASFLTTAFARGTTNQDNHHPALTFCSQSHHFETASRSFFTRCSFKINPPWSAATPIHLGLH